MKLTFLLLIKKCVVLKVMYLHYRGMFRLYRKQVISLKLQKMWGCFVKNDDSGWLALSAEESERKEYE